VVATGDSYHLAELGTANWENVVPNPSTGDQTLVIAPVIRPAATSSSTPAPK
jgi:hypothetical protein